MGIYYEKPKPIIKRVATVKDVTEKILRFDSDNLYPQRCEEVLARSSTLKTVINRITDFVNGEGFADPIIAKMVVNRRGLEGQTLNQVMKATARNLVRYLTPVMHVNYNGLGQLVEMNPVRFERIRFAIADANGKICKLAYSANWEKDGRKGQDQGITFYDRFNPNAEVVLEQIEAAGGISNYRGQIIYLTPDADEYPLAAFDAVMDDAQVQAEVGLAKVGNTQNSFLGTLAILYPGEFGSPAEENDFKNLIHNKTGARNTGKTIGLQDRSGQRKASDIFANLTPVNLDKLFELTERTVKENIMESESFPAILMGKAPTGLFAQGDIEEVYTYVNSITRNRRTELENFFSTLLKYWHEPVITDAKIIEQRYIIQSEQDLPGLAVNDNLKNMTGKQAIQFERILRKYGKGLYNRETAAQLLRGGFGLTEAEIAKLLDGMDQLIQEEKDQADPQAPAAVALMQRKYLNFVNTAVAAYL